VAVAYVDTSCLVAIAFGEPEWKSVRRRLGRFSDLVSSNLLESEFRATCAREKLPFNAKLLGGLRWVFPDRALSPEMEVALSLGLAVKGADLWHLACALYLTDRRMDLTFLTLDARQRDVAARLGFET
jgi:hypothetical protein